jgi:DNA (cytosine-5)-methyltransferase 1
MGYCVEWEVLNSKNFGVPQNRERVFLVGIRDDIDNTFRFPIEEHLFKRLKNILEQEVDDKYFITQEKIEYLKRSDVTGWGKNLIDGEKDISYCIDASYSKGHRGATIVKIEKNESVILDCYNNNIRNDGTSGTITQHCSRSGMTNGMKVIESNDIKIGDFRSDEGFRWRKDGNSPAIMAMMRDTWKDNYTDKNPPIIHKDYKIRRLTPRECFRLMDFPDSFTWTCSDSQAYKQAGNSIVVNVLYKILKNLNLSKSTT